MARMNGLYEESMRKYGNPNAFKYCMNACDYFCVAAIVEGKLFCVHGGLSPSIPHLDQISSINRLLDYDEPHKDSPYVDLLWSDP